MRSRPVTIAGAIVAAGVIGTTAFLLASSGPDEEPAAAPPVSTAATASSTSTTTTPTTTSTTLPPTTTSTTLPPPPVTVTSGGPARLTDQILALYTWVLDRDEPRPAIPEGLADHVAGIPPAAPGETLDLEAEVHEGTLADGTRVAVALVGEDLLLGVRGEGGWRLVGARLTRFGLRPWYGDPVRHVLLIGTDARPHQDPPRYRADSIHVVAASMEEGGGAIVGFPRDTYVSASYGNDKFSSVNARSGTPEMVEIAERLSGVEIDGYLLTGFAGFKRMVNRLGGVEVVVPFAMNDYDSKAYLDAGLQVLDGADALAFSRNRHLSGGDFTRSFHQGVVIGAVLTGSQAMGVERLPTLLEILSNHSWTDLTAAELLQLGAMAYEVDPAGIGNVVLPGRVGTAGGASIVRLTDAAGAVFEDLADGVITPPG